MRALVHRRGYSVWPIRCGCTQSAWANWRTALPGLARSRRVLAPDIVGFGYTDSPDDFTYDRDNRVTCSASSTPTTCPRSPSSAGTDSVVRGVDVVLEDEAGDRHQQKRTRYHQQPDVEERQ